MKRLFDFSVSLIVILVFSPFIILLTLISAIDTRSTGVYTQERIGRNGFPFSIYKIRSFHKYNNKVSVFGKMIRRIKLDEILQLINVVKGDMSLVGPRPDVKGYYDSLNGKYKRILSLRPGITSMAAICYYNEEELLNKETDPELYAKDILFPKKVMMNYDYYLNRSFFLDLKILLKTFKVVISKGVFKN